MSLLHFLNLRLRLPDFHGALSTYNVVTKYLFEFKTIHENEFLRKLTLEIFLKATTGMIAVARRRDTDVEEREERISHLEKVIDSCLACVC